MLQLLIFVGFGDYLHSIDPSRSWNEHLQHILIFCRVHAERNFFKRYHNHTMRHYIQQIWKAEKKQDVIRYMNRACQAYTELAPWFNAKKNPWILSALCQEVSKIDTLWWKIAHKNTNLCESSHFEDNYFTGKSISLLAGVMR